MILAFIFSVLRLSTPMLFTAMGGLFSERAGVVNIALEGFMLMGAFSAAVVTLATGSPVLGFCAAGVVGILFALIYAFFVIHGRANQIVAGTAMNLLAMGMIPLLLKILYESTGATPSLNMDQRFAIFPLWFVWILVLVVWGIMRSSPFGLWISFAGENPQALDAAGISVLRVRYAGVALSGLLAAWGGASLSIFLASGYSRNMVAGRGFMALAALIFGKWRPVPAALACVFFGLMEALQIRLQSTELGQMIPAQFVQMIPYLATMIVLAGFVGRMRAPKALGSVFEKK
jgi:ABC-type uncharacterized transport system permease subunit